MPIPALPAVFVAGTAARVFTALAARAGTDAAVKVTLNALRVSSIAQMVSAPRKETYRAPKYNAAGNLSGSGFGRESDTNASKGKVKKRKRITGLRKSRAALGFGKRTTNRNRGPASIRDIKRAGRTSARRGNRALARFINARYGAKAIAKYNDYAGRLRRSKRLIAQIVKIDDNTFRIRRHIVKTDTAGNNPYSCTCPDFSQFSSEESRDWLGSAAGPFNPCKHMMAVRDRKKGQWVCQDGVCTLDPNATEGFATQALCEASIIPSVLTGGQCDGVKYGIFVTFDLSNPPFTGNTAFLSNCIDIDSVATFGPISISSGLSTTPTNRTAIFLTYKNDLGVTVTRESNVSGENRVITLVSATATRCDGLPDDCGDPPGTCGA